MLYEVITVSTGAVVEQQEDAGDDLDDEEEEGDAAEVVPDGMPVFRDAFMLDKLLDAAQVNAFLYPAGQCGTNGFHMQLPLVKFALHELRRP